MKRLAFMAAFSTAFNAYASADPLCEVARAELERYAQAHEMEVEVRCRAPGGYQPPAAATLQAAPWPRDQVPRGGALTWPVRVVSGNARPYVRQVPLTTVWTAPAWVGTHALQSGAQLQPGDMELQSRRWPEGLAVQPGDIEHPPTGRLRQSLRSGDILSVAALVPNDMLQRGDHVTAVLTEGAVEIRLPAQLLAPARIGERARVQANSRTAALDGRLMDPQTFRVDSE
ncbi:flagella basal body P-ring formation protein FlgA [Roseateles sp. NT4]|uniref:flagella basal body P-ring formation protein FlgA n=1 Tax=Roseateles sp. NT4 TaxID=3453715 RepID=UPI003EED1251